MKLHPIPVSKESAAEAVARRIVQVVHQAAQTVATLRKGIPASKPQEARSLPDGRIIPARVAGPAVSAKEIEEKLGPANIAALDALAKTL